MDVLTLRKDMRMTVHKVDAFPDLKTVTEALRRKPYIRISIQAASGDWLEIFDPKNASISSLLVRLVKPISPEEFERATGVSRNSDTPYHWLVSEEDLDILVEQILAELPVTDLIAA